MSTVEIDGNEFSINLASYKVRDMADYAPRASVPGGAIAYSDLLTYQPVVMTDWRHGFGFHWFQDAEGYMRTEGSVDTRQAGIACLYTRPYLSYYGSTSSGIFEGFTSWNGNLYCHGGGYLLQLSGASTWAEVDTTAGSGWKLSALATQDYFFYCPDNARLRKYNGSTFSESGVGSSAMDFHWMTIHNGYVYAGIQGTNYVHYASETDLSDLDGGSPVAKGGSDTGTITVGGGGFATIGALSYASSLYISRPDGLWALGDDRIARRIVNCFNETSSSNFRSMAEHNGYLIFPIKDRLMQWNGTRLTDITPPRVTDVYPYTVYREFDNLVVIGNYLYLTAKPTVIGTASSAAEDTDLICFDGVGWFKLSTLIDGFATRSVTAMGYDPYRNALYYSIYQGALSHSHEIYYIAMDGKSDYPYPYFEAAVETNCLITSRIDCGFRRVTKSTPSIFVDASNVSAARYIKVYYSLDGDTSWTLLGSVTSVGTTELPVSTGTLEYNYIQLKFVFYTNSSAQTPILEGFVLRVLLRPDEFYGWNFDVIASSNQIEGMTEDDRTGKEIIEQLRAARASKSPIVFKDVHGIEYSAYISAISEYGLEEHVDEMGAYTDIEFRVNVNVVEAA